MIISSFFLFLLCIFVSILFLFFLRMDFHELIINVIIIFTVTGHSAGSNDHQKTAAIMPA